MKRFPSATLPGKPERSHGRFLRDWANASSAKWGRCPLASDAPVRLGRAASLTGHHHRTCRQSSPMFQVVFNEISAGEMAALPKELQLDLLAEFEGLPEDPESLDPEKFGVIERDGQRLFRYRAKDYRIY